MCLQSEFRTAILAAGDKQSTFETYWPHVCHFITFARRRHNRPIDRHEATIDDVYAWRDYLAGHCHLSPRSCNQAISAVKFLFANVIGKPLESQEGRPLRLKQPKRSRRRLIPKEDLRRFFVELRFRDRLVAQLQYAGLMRLSDVVRLRTKDLNFADEQIQLATTKHDHFRIVPFPKSLHADVRRQLATVELIHRADATENRNGVPVDYAYARKCPSAPRSFDWYWLFPSGNLSRDPDDGKLKRYHADKGNIARNYGDARRRAGITRRLTSHDLRRSAATHLHLSGTPLTKIQTILGHNSIEQTREYIMDDESQLSGADSPFDRLMSSD